MEEIYADLANGTRLRYLKRPGAGAVVVMLHGITDTADSYRPCIASIGADACLYVLDHRGHGHSSKPDDRYTTDAYADDVRAFIPTVSDAPVLLAGHSLGGLVAVQVAATAPELVSSLLLEDPPLYFVNAITDVYQAIFTGTIGVASSIQDGSKTRDDWFNVMKELPDPFTGEPSTMSEQQVRERVDAVALMKPKAMADALDGALKWDTDATLQRVQCPVHLLTGNPTLGAVIAEGEAARVADVIDDLTHAHFDDVGHLLHQERPEQYAQLVTNWILH
ncbi:MAG: alpha/beta hydrolase [Gammaproteobacteria bacterium]|nr:alpha/beta hydrolase [Gammaproteobacteria bacterium]